MVERFQGEIDALRLRLSNAEETIRRLTTAAQAEVQSGYPPTAQGLRDFCLQIVNGEVVLVQPTAPHEPTPGCQIYSLGSQRPVHIAKTVQSMHIVKQEGNEISIPAAQPNQAMPQVTPNSPEVQPRAGPSRWEGALRSPPFARFNQPDIPTGLSDLLILEASTRRSGEGDGLDHFIQYSSDNEHPV
jgi:hypothetical protein